MTKAEKIIRKINSVIHLEPELPDPEFCDDYSRTIQRVNLIRIRIFSIILFILMTLFTWRDYFISRKEGLWEENIAYYELFILHTVLLFLSIIFYFLSRSKLKTVQNTFKTANVTSILYGFLIIAWCAFLSGWVTQKVNEHITEYIIAVFGIASSLFYRPLASIVIFVFAEVFFIVILNISLEDPNSSGHITNSIVLTVIAWFISRFSYTARLRQFVNLRTISLQKKEIESVNEALQNQNVYLEELNKEKTEFMGIVAHDLKNPLAAIILGAETTLRYGKQLGQEQNEKTLRQMHTTAIRMKTIVTNLLDINSIETGKLNIKKERFDPIDTIKQVIETFQQAADKKSIRLYYSSIPSQTQLYTDIALFHEIADNIISNAIKYSNTDSDVYIASDIKTKNDDSFFEFSVKDNGPGLTEEDKKKLFGKFERLSAQPTGGEHSTGLGLAIVKKLTEAMGGNVLCESEYGKGATFIVRFPLN